MAWHRILAPTDFSEPGDLAVKRAARMAARADGELHLAHVIAARIGYAEMPEMMLPPMEDLVEEMCAAARKRLEKLAESLEDAPAAAIHVEESLGRPADAIVALAREIGADLIVMGSHGHTGLLHVLLGSTAERVVREAPCDVLVVKPDANREDNKET
jgi:nucleotide-binding universal stress UspA family protein